MGSWNSGGNQYIQLVNVLDCKLLTNGGQPHKLSHSRSGPDLNSDVRGEQVVNDGLSISNISIG